MLELFLWTLGSFILGSIPFSLILTRLLAHKDIRTVGDGNPGGTNAVKAGGLKVGLPAILLDIGKGFLPVYLAQRFGLSGWNLLPVCLAPAAGHAFSPFLGFKGGKALAPIGGAWIALTGLRTFPIYGALALPTFLFQTEDAWSALAGMFSLLGYALIFGEPWMVGLAALNTLLATWTHHRDLVRPPQLRPWVHSLLVRRQA
jgi:glycerol-3-phosphate acyltransferase PlsY